MVLMPRGCKNTGYISLPAMSIIWAEWVPALISVAIYQLRSYLRKPLRFVKVRNSLSIYNFTSTFPVWNTPFFWFRGRKAITSIHWTGGDPGMVWDSGQSDRLHTKTIRAYLQPLGRELLSITLNVGPQQPVPCKGWGFAIDRCCSECSGKVKQPLVAGTLQSS